MVGLLIRAYARAGRRDDTLRLLTELKKKEQTGYIPGAAFVNFLMSMDFSFFSWISLRLCFHEASASGFQLSEQY